MLGWKTGKSHPSSPKLLHLCDLTCSITPCLSFRRIGRAHIIYMCLAYLLYCNCTVRLERKINISYLILNFFNSVRKRQLLKYGQIILLKYFCKTHFFCGIPFRSDSPSFGIGSSAELGMPWNKHFLPRNNGNHSESIPFPTLIGRGEDETVGLIAGGGGVWPWVQLKEILSWRRRSLVRKPGPLV